MVLEREWSNVDQPQARHYEIWVYCQSTSKVHAQVLQNLRMQEPQAGIALAGDR